MQLVSILSLLLWSSTASAQFRKCKQRPQSQSQAPPPPASQLGPPANYGGGDGVPLSQTQSLIPDAGIPSPSVSISDGLQPAESSTRGPAAYPSNTPEAPSTPSSGRGKRGIAWAAESNAAEALSGGQMTWQMAWQNSPVEGLNLEYYPMLWGGGDAETRFDDVMQSIGGSPKYILAMNEPNIEGQSGLDFGAAAALYKRKLQPYADQGIGIAAPAISYDAQYLSNFFQACEGCTFHAIQAHWYGGYDEIENFKSWIEELHTSFKDIANEIWVTEWGCTAASGGSEQQVLDFMKASTQWLEDPAQSYVTKIAWFGAWSKNPDGYASDFNSLVDGNGRLTTAGQFWVNNV